MTNLKKNQNEKTQEVLVDILKDAKVMMLNTLSKEGKIVTRPMQAQEIEFDGDLWFITRKDTEKYEEIKANPMVNVAVAGDSYASISGKAVFIDDKERKKNFGIRLMKKCST